MEQIRGPRQESISSAVALHRLMAKNHKGSRYKGYRKLPINVDVAGGTLAADDVTQTTPSEVMTEERRVLSLEASWGLTGLTATDGPLVVGVAHSDYTATEIEEALEAAGAWDEGNLVAQEQAKRLVRQVGILTEEETALNDGQPVKTRLNWRLATGDTLQYWLWNRGVQLTTGSLVKVSGHLHTVLV